MYGHFADAMVNFLSPTHSVYPLVRSARNGPLRATPERPSALREAADFTADCYIGMSSSMLDPHLAEKSFC